MRTIGDEIGIIIATSAKQNANIAATAAAEAALIIAALIMLSLFAMPLQVTSPLELGLPDRAWPEL